MRSSPDPLFGLPALSIDMELYTEFVLAGLSGLAGDAVADPSAPYLPIGKFSTIGDSALGSKDVLIGEVMTPSKPNPPGGYSSSGGGVGVRGGAGIGKVVAMANNADAMSGRDSSRSDLCK